MNTVIVWILVTVNGYSQAFYSPPMPDKETCEHLHKSADEIRIMNSRCVQIKMMVPK